MERTSWCRRCQPVVPLEEGSLCLALILNLYIHGLGRLVMLEEVVNIIIVLLQISLTSDALI